MPHSHGFLAITFPDFDRALKSSVYGAHIQSKADGIQCSLTCVTDKSVSLGSKLADQAVECFRCYPRCQVGPLCGVAKGFSLRALLA